MPKFMYEKDRKTGKIYVVSPPSYVKEAVGAEYAQFEDRQAAVAHAQNISDQWDAHRMAEGGKAVTLDKSVEGVIRWYQTTPAWDKLKINSRKFYRLLFDTALDVRLGKAKFPFAMYTARNVTAQNADDLYMHIKRTVSEHRAYHVLKVLRRVWNVARRSNKVGHNPFEKMDLSAPSSRVVLWEPEQVALFIATADSTGANSVGTLALLCYDLCQRPGDMRQLKWGNYSGGVLSFIQEKTGTEIQIPASPRLQERLDALKTPSAAQEDFIVVKESCGLPYDRWGYAKVARRVRDAAGLPKELQIRDLRRTGATEMAESGCTEDELRSVTGHKDRDVLNIYVRPSTKLAMAGINRRFKA